MTLFRVRVLILSAALAMCSGAARADLYGFVEGSRVSVMYSDVQPADERYQPYRKVQPGQFIALSDQAHGRQRLTPSRYSAHILAAAKATKVDAALIHAVISEI